MGKINRIIENKFFNLIIAFLLTQPLVDAITSIMINVFKINFTLGIIFKFFLLIFTMYCYLFVFKIKNKKIILYALFFIIYMIIYYLFNDLYSVKETIKIAFFPILLLMLYDIFKKKKYIINYRFFLVTSIIYSMLVIFPYFFNMGFESYKVAKLGNLGLFNSANEISCILSIILPLAFYYLFDNFKIYKVFYIIIILTAILIIGTKAPLIVFIMCIMFYLIKYLKRLIDLKEFKKIIIIMFLLIFAIIISFILIKKTYVYKNIIIHLKFLKIKRISDLFNYKILDHFLLGSRLKFSKKIILKYLKSNYIRKIIGIGYLLPKKMAEIDIIDILFRNGIFVTFIVLPFIYIIKKTVNKDNKYLLSIFFAILLSNITGHVLTAPSVSFILLLILLSCFICKGENDMKKVLITSYNLDYGGIETSLINFLKKIDLKKYKVTLVLEQKKGIYLKEVPSKIEIKEYKVNNNKNIFIRKIINLIKRIVWLINNYKKYDVGICYATYSLPGGFLVRSSSNNKILYVHSNYCLTFNKDEDKIKNFFDKLKIQKYNHVVFVSNESKKDLCKIYSKLKKKAVTINNFVDQDYIFKLSNEKVDLPKSKKMKFVFVGRLDESSKRLTLLLDVAKKCIKEDVNAEFWIIGAGLDEEMYKGIKKEQNLNNVIFMGAKKNPYPYIKASDYMILTSRYEGFPVVFNEAIVLNKPIITTIDASDDYITIPNRFGYVVSENDLFKKVKELSKKKKITSEIVDFNKLNEKRLKKIENIMEN